MRNLNFILMLFFFSIFVVKSQAQTNITADFTDPNFLVEVYNAVQKTAPQPIYDTDVEEITYLYVSNKNISSLAGLEHFIALKVLFCDSNRLTTLDVSMLTTLRFFYCEYNQLTSLNVSNLTNLSEIFCNDNQLTSLDVSDLTNLYTLQCHSNHITSLDVSMLTNLPELICGNNPLTSLDVSNLTNLRMLSCWNNQLTSLDVSNLTKLQEFACLGNQLTSLDISNLTNLQELYCSDNLLTTLDISGLNQLQILDCRYNYLTKDPTGYNPSITTEYYFDPQKTGGTAVIGISDVSAEVKVYIFGNILYVNSPASEIINLYSASGSLLYTTKKQSGEIQIPLNSIQGKMFIVKSNSGWVKKDIRK